jgi:hydrogenase/urease accessory protein HupE
MFNRFSRLVAGACFALICALPALAHERIGTYSHAVVTVSGNSVSYYLNLPPQTSQLLRSSIGVSDVDLADYFAAVIRLTTWDQECVLTNLVQIPPLPSGNRIIDLTFQCPKAVSDLTITSLLLLDLDESHTQFLRLAPPDKPNEVLHEAVLKLSNQSFHVADVKTGGSATLERALAFLKLGIEHLLTGYDHILFLLTVIIGLTLMESIKAVTSFTVAHSLTMALAFLGAISLPPHIVEPLIALTVIYVAIENIVRKNIRRRWIWTFVFGLIHGLGFVGALKVITISRSELVLSLVSFNIGIELGQIVVVALAMFAFWSIRNYAWTTKLNHGFSAAVAVLGVVWLGQRVLG